MAIHPLTIKQYDFPRKSSYELIYIPDIGILIYIELFK